jgi:hypothetical protein
MTVGRVVWLYCVTLGAGLLVEGGVLLALQAFNLYAGDVRHNALHAGWGILILYLVISDRSARRAALTALVFGVVYTALAVVGVLTTNPLGLQLGPAENVFHFVVGPVALALGAWSVTHLASSRASISAKSASTSGSTSSS